MGQLHRERAGTRVEMTGTTQVTASGLDPPLLGRERLTASAAATNDLVRSVGVTGRQGARVYWTVARGDDHRVARPSGWARPAGGCRFMSSLSPSPRAVYLRAMRVTSSRWAELLMVVGLGTAITACRPSPAPSSLPQHYTDKNAAIARFDDPERDAWAMPDRVVAALPIDDPTATLADIGAGSGYFSRRLATRVPDGRVYAVDVDGDFKRHIEDNRQAWGTPNVVPRLAVYENPLLPAGEVDLVFLSNTYAFIRDRVTYFQAVYTALRANGVVAVIEFRESADCTAAHGCPHPDQRVSRDTAVRELEQAGFRLEREETFLPLQYFLILRRVDPN